MQAQPINVADVVATQSRNALVTRLIVIATLLMLVDGFDLQTIAFAAPSIIADWKVDRSLFGPVFSAGLAGLMVGSILFGYLGDRLGRRPMILIAIAIVGIFTTATVFASDMTHLLVLRFLTGIGVGGLSPICYALCIEYAPPQRRGFFVAVIMFGYVLGTSLGGLLAAWIIPSYGWHSLFIVGGIPALILLLVAYVWLPESLEFLVRRDPRSPQAASIVSAITGRPVAAGTTFVSGQEAKAAADTNIIAIVRSLFSPDFRLATAVIWLAYIASSLTMFFLISWMPVLIESFGRNVSEAAIALTVLSMAGALGGLLAGYIVDRYGARGLMIMPLIAGPIAASLGYIRLDNLLYLVVIFVTGFFVVGAHQGLNSTVGKLYPSERRANGVGLALAVAKFGAIFGPLLGGLLIAAQVDRSTLFLVAALPEIIVFLCLFLLSTRQRAAASQPILQPASQR
ncbi:MAG: hypothetical protein BGP04_19140 [Rhizobiales bacterium 62-17]|nr:MFS transporter [Hyphomicrobiales bacterium]OJX99787.1 MAG: hypothetical protein BGP04_19140 [Rhizobiales bacterium 62-17]